MATRPTLDGMPPSPVLIVVALVAMAAGALAYRPFLMGLAGMVLAIFARLVNVGVFGAAIVPAAGPAWLSRLAVLVAIGVGAGMVTAAGSRLRTAPDAVHIDRRFHGA